MTTPDGYAMAEGIVQGARTYDTVSGQWLTPDPYAGDVHNPMSQKPFMWNGNNPFEWTDPSGYDPYLIFDPSGVKGFGHIEIAVIDHNTGKGTLWTQGPANNNRPVDRQVITQRPISLANLENMQHAGFNIVYEQTSASQDASMNAKASQLQKMSQSTRTPFTLTIATCLRVTFSLREILPWDRT